MYLRTVLRSWPVRRAMAATVSPCRARSRIMTSSPSVTPASSRDAGRHLGGRRAPGSGAWPSRRTEEGSGSASGEHSPSSYTRQPGLEDGVLLAVEVVLARAQEGEELPLGDADAQGPQLGQQALGGDLPLDVLHQGEAHDAGTEMAPHLCRQWGDDRPPVRGHPPLPPVADDQGREQQVLDRVGLVALTWGLSCQQGQSRPQWPRG